MMPSSESSSMGYLLETRQDMEVKSHSYSTETQHLQNILPVKLLYGYESWVLTQKLEDNFNSYATNCYRIILGICNHDRVSNVTIYRMTNQQPLPQLIRQRQLKWLGTSSGNQMMSSLTIFWLISYYNFGIFLLTNLNCWQKSQVLSKVFGQKSYDLNRFLVKFLSENNFFIYLTLWLLWQKQISPKASKLRPYHPSTHFVSMNVLYVSE